MAADLPPPDPGFIRFGAESLLKELNALRAEIEGVRQGKDLECVHRMRVSTRRLRTRLALFEEGLPAKKAPGWRKQMRRLTQALGAARDADVQLFWLEEVLGGLSENRLRPGIERLRLRLRQQRARLQSRVIRALDRLAAAQTVEDMEKSLRRLRVRGGGPAEERPSPASLRRARRAISPRLAEMLGFEIYVNQPERARELHQMRIAAKRLRYAMEVFAPWFEGELKPELKAAKALQEVLGDIHDGDVWIAFLPEFLDSERQRAVKYFGHARPSGRLKAGLLHLLQDREEFRRRRHRDLVALWEKTGEKGLWKDLMEKTGAPPTPVPGLEANEVPEPAAGDAPGPAAGEVPGPAGEEPPS